MFSGTEIATMSPILRGSAQLLENHDVAGLDRRRHARRHHRGQRRPDAEVGEAADRGRDHDGGGQPAPPEPATDEARCDAPAPRTGSSALPERPCGSAPGAREIARPLSGGRGRRGGWRGTWRYGGGAGDPAPPDRAIELGGALDRGDELRPGRRARVLRGADERAVDVVAGRLRRRRCSTWRRRRARSSRRPSPRRRSQGSARRWSRRSRRWRSRRGCPRRPRR